LWESPASGDIFTPFLQLLVTRGTPVKPAGLLRYSQLYDLATAPSKDIKTKFDISLIFIILTAIATPDTIANHCNYNKLHYV
jgi:hypothetical protein